MVYSGRLGSLRTSFLCFALFFGATLPNFTSWLFIFSPNTPPSSSSAFLGNKRASDTPQPAGFHIRRQPTFGPLSTTRASFARKMCVIHANSPLTGIYPEAIWFNPVLMPLNVRCSRQKYKAHSSRKGKLNRIQAPPTSQSHWAIGFISRPWSWLLWATEWMIHLELQSRRRDMLSVCSLLRSQLASSSSGGSANTVNVVCSVFLRCIWIERRPSSGKYIPPWFSHSAAVWLTTQEVALQQNLQSFSSPKMPMLHHVNDPGRTLRSLSAVLLAPLAGRRVQNRPQRAAVKTSRPRVKWLWDSSLNVSSQAPHRSAHVKLSC